MRGIKIGCRYRDGGRSVTGVREKGWMFVYLNSYSDHWQTTPWILSTIKEAKHSDWGKHKYRRAKISIILVTCHDRKWKILWVSRIHMIDSSMGSPCKCDVENCWDAHRGCGIDLHQTLSWFPQQRQRKPETARNQERLVVALGTQFHPLS